jgi:hypothetical protein
MGVIKPELIKAVINPALPQKAAGLIKTGISKSKGVVKEFFRQKRAVRLQQCEQFADTAVTVAKRWHSRLPFGAKVMPEKREAFMREFARNRADDMMSALTMVRAVEKPTPGTITAATKDAVYQMPGIMQRKYHNVKTGIVQRDWRRIAMY